MIPPRVRRCTVSLHYPDHWAVRPNPRAEEYAARAWAWLSAKGLQTGDGERFRSLAVGELANWPFPFADDARAEVMTKALAWRMMRGGECPEELRTAFTGAMSAGWVARHLGRLREWARAKGGERGTVRAELARLRARSGMLPAMDFVEYEIGWELPEEVFADSAMREVEEAAGDCMAIMKDLFGETELVAYVMEEFGDSAGEAFKWVNNMHARQVRRLRDLEAGFYERYPQHPMLTAWFDALHCVIYGFAQWHSRAPHCRTVHERTGWAVTVTVSPACPEPF